MHFPGLQSHSNREACRLKRKGKRINAFAPYSLRTLRFHIPRALLIEDRSDGLIRIHRDLANIWRTYRAV